MVDMGLILTPNENCPVREIGDGLVIMADTGDTTHSLDEIGSFIWRQLDGRRDLNEIVKTMTREYEVDAEQAGADLSSFVEKLIAENLVRTIRVKSV